MAAKLTRLSHKTVIRLHLVAESCTICSSRARRPVRKLLDTPSYIIRYETHLNHLTEANAESCIRTRVLADQDL
jgi:hypothetical protein